MHASPEQRMKSLLFSWYMMIEQTFVLLLVWTVALELEKLGNDKKKNNNNEEISKVGKD